MANLAAVLDDTSSNGKKIKQIYDDLELSMEGTNGQMKSGFELLSDLAGKWPSLSSDTQKYIATTIAGTTQLNNFVALMNNFGHATKATETALDSAGSAAEENARYMGGLEAQTAAVNDEFESLANNVIPNELISAFLKAGKAILSFVNNDVGAFITRFALVGSVIFGGGNILLGYVAKIKQMIVAVKAASGAMAALQASLGWISLALGVIAAVLPLVIDKWNESHKSISELNDEIKGMNDQLRTNKERLEEINGLSWNDRTAEITQEYYALLKENEELERNIRLNQEKVKKKADTDKIVTGKEYKVGNAFQPSGIIPKLQVEYQEGTLDKETFDKAVRWVNEINDALSGTVDSYDDIVEQLNKIKLIEQLPGMAQYASDLESMYTGLLNSVVAQDTYVKGVADTIPIMQEYQQQLEQTGTLTAAQNEDYVELMSSSGEYYVSLRNLKEAGRALTPQQQQFIEQYEILNKLYNDAANATNTFGISIQQINSISPALKKYMDENGYSINSFAAYCKSAGVDADNLADSIKKVAVASKILEIEQFRKENSGIAYIIETGMSSGTTQAQQYLSTLSRLQKELGDIKNMSFDIGGTTTTGGGGGGSKSLTQAERNLQAFQKQHAYFEHELAMGEITEEQYYYHLHDLMNMYLQDAENVETLWKYQEKIYKHSQEELQNYYQEQLDQQNALIDKINERFDAEIDGLEKSNDELEKQIEYEQLLEDMASAKAKKSLVFKNGAFQYVEDVDAISSAQNALRKYYRQQEVEQKKQNIEAARQRELREPQQLVSRLEEIIKNIKGYATGTTYSAGGLSLVGEHGAELAVLSKGTGVIPADITKNLWAWGQTTPSALMSTVAGVNGQNGGIYFSGVTMSFPSVRNGNDAQSFMQSVVNLAYQRAYSRK